MTPAEILAQAAQRGVEVGLNPAGDGLRLWSDGDPPTDLVELLKSAKPELVAHLHRRAYDGPLLQSVEAARPPDVSDDAWQTALRGLRDFIANGHGDEALRLGWPRDELFRVPELWSAMISCGVGCRSATARSSRSRRPGIRIRTASGRRQGFLPATQARLRPRLPRAHQDGRRRRSLRRSRRRGQAARVRSRGQPLPQSSSRCRRRYRQAAVLAAMKGEAR